MGRIKNPVAEKTSAKLSTTPGMHAVGGTPGLYLRVTGAARSWIFRYSMNGKRRDLGLGSYGDLSLAEAREKARLQRKLILDGIDPIDAKRDQRQTAIASAIKRMSFSQCVAGYLDAHGDGWKNPKHRQQWQNTLATYAEKQIGAVNVAAVDTPMVLKILEPIWKTKTETATRVRGRIEAVLDWATVRQYRTGDNPARWKGHLDQLLVNPSKVANSGHHAALPYSETGAFMAKLREQKGFSASALEFLILTAARSGEVRGATWSEIDQQNAVWTIPAERMKMGKEHRVPLSEASMKIIKDMDKLKFNQFVFPGQKEGRPLSDMSLTAVLKRMERGDLTAHGFRSTFRDWAAESTGYPREVVEMALAHAIENKVEAAYRRGDLFAKRAQLMAEWAKYCAIEQSTDANVVPIRKDTAA